MNSSDYYLIKTLKKELARAIVNANYNLLTPEILSLSKKLDDLMNPLFKKQLDLKPYTS